VKRVRNTLTSDRLVVDRLTDEARLLCQISHPNVVRALDHGTGNDGMPFLVMDRASGTPLHEVIERHDPLPRERLAAIASQLFAGLAAIHDAGIIHADLKSHNVLVDEVDIVTIIDLGLARTVVEAPETSGLVAGTPAYMAPELIAGAHPTVGGDVYAAATIVYEMLTGTTPFSGHISTILTRQLSEPVEPPSRRAPGRDISPEIDRVLLRALDASPDARFRGVAEFAEAFSAAIGGRPVPVLNTASAPRIGAPAPRRPTARSERIAAALPTERLDDRVDPTEAAITTALGKAQRLIEGRRMTEAVQWLETTLAGLPVIPESGASSTEAWRIETVLAALYDTIGKQDCARRMALIAYRHAMRSGCPLAEARASELVDRLTVRSRRVARGSMPVRR
ncbi:MAG TPA: serine/threonine-protein kinase, partial [Kofleriaceae bacterium]|nr:serine/threonine-protein kinase [Kofleriaceae bacterium]